MFISPETIDAVRERAPIEDIVRRYVPSLKKRGKNFIGLCPFHKEKTPSFTVSAEKRMFHCFGCHAGGNVFTFISKIENVNFAESVKIVADYMGIPVVENAPRTDPQRDAVLSLNRRAADHFSAYLRSHAGKQAMKYLADRGVRPESIDAFMLGFAPESWDHLKKQLEKARIPFELAETVGLLSSTQKNDAKHYYDKFRNRIMFPIMDATGRVIAFGGRIIGDGQPKYLNSPESDVFRKRSVLYGFNRARASIAETKRAIIVEGYLDVIGCHQEGVTNVVAPMGTALTQDHVKLLLPLCTEIILLFDADSAGINASMRSLEIADEFNVDVRVAALPESDPFEFILGKGIRALMAVVESALTPPDYKISRIATATAPAERLKSLIQMFGVVASMKFETERSGYLRKISMLLGMDENAVRTDFKKYLAKQTITAPDDNGGHSRSGTDFMRKSSRRLVTLLLRHPELIEKATIDFTESDLSDEIAARVFAKIAGIYFSHSQFTPDKIFDFFDGGQEMELLNQAFGEKYSVKDPSNEYTELFLNIKIHQIDEKINKYVDLIKSNTNEKYNSYLTELEILRREKEKLRYYIYNR